MTPPLLIDHGEIELVLAYGIHPYFLASLVQEGTLHITKEKHKQQPSHKQTLYLQCTPATKI